MATQAQITAVQQLYVSYLGRAADSAGLAFWSNAISTGTATVASVATGLTLANEYKTAYAGLTNDALVDKVYTNVLGRPADAAGKAFWVASFANGSVKADTFVSSLISSLGTQDQQTINNKTFVAQTYTDTAGASYSPVAAAAVLVGVNNTVASVNTAITAINSGTLVGLVPGAGLINALATAQTAEAAVQTGNTATVNTLVTKLAANVTAGTATDLLAANATYAQKVAAITADANTFRTAVSTDSTTVLTAKAADAAKAVDTARTALTADGKTKAATYESAVKANVALTGAKAADVAAVKAGLTADTTFDAAVIAKAAAVDPSITNSSTLYDFYVAATTTAAQRANLDTALKDVPYLATFKATATVDVTKNAAVKAEADAKTAIDAADGNDGVANAAGEFSAILKLKTDADTLVTKAIAADADVAAVKVVTDANKVANDASLKAAADITAFNSANTAAKIVNIGNVSGDAAVKESFYFADKVGLTAGTDYTIGTATAATQFGTGDSIVLGTGYTFNSGALTTGNNNALEFFLVKTDTGTQVVVESTAFGSAAVTANASTGVATAADAVTVINLVGVTADHLSVANGVVSYV